jgi:hypothetical protein
MNKIAEKVNWSDGAYWGEPGKMKFRTRIDNFTDATEVTDRERIVKTEFSITLYGYLIPEAFNNLVTTQKYLTPKKIIVGTETDINVSSIVKQDEGVQEVRIAGGSVTPRQTVTEHPLILKAGTGIAISDDGVEWIGAQRLVQTISFGGDRLDVITMSASNAIEVAGELTITGSGVLGDWNVDGALSSTGDLNVAGNAIIQGDLTAQSYNSELVESTVLYESGSTKFGDDTGDTHEFTGSLDVSGSLFLNGSAVGTGVSTFDEYNRKTFVKKNTTLVGNSTASFTAVTASAPVGMTATSEDDFVFFLNGQYMEHDALEIEQANGTFYLKVDTDSIGYSLESDDEIISWGKFNS